MDWCVEEFEDANHNPVAAINGEREEKIHYIKSKPGQNIELDASASSDPDGDQIQFSWWIYDEAGTYHSEVELINSDKPKVTVQIPDNAKDKEIHLIVEVSDNNEIASLHDYRRIVLVVD